MRFIFFLVSIFCYTNFSANAQSISGVWEGIGIVKSSKDLAIISRLYIDQKPNDPQSIIGQLDYFILGSDFKDRLFRINFEAKRNKDGTLLVIDNSVYPEEERGVERVFQLVSQNGNQKLLMSGVRKNSADTAMYFVFEKESDALDFGIHLQASTKCMLANTVVDVEPGILFPPLLGLDENSEADALDKMNYCLNKQLDLKNAKIQFIAGLNMLMIKIKGLSPVLVAATEDEALQFMNARDNMRFDVYNCALLPKNDKTDYAWSLIREAHIYNLATSYHKDFMVSKMDDLAYNPSLASYIKSNFANQIDKKEKGDGNDLKTIDHNLITLSTDKEFKWIEWEQVPGIVKENLKKIPYYRESSYFDNIMETIQWECMVQVAITDLNNNGIYGIAISSLGSSCCGTRGCSFTFMEDGGTLISELGTDHEVTPSNNAVISSAGLKFPMKPNKGISVSKAEELKRIFKYKEVSGNVNTSSSNKEVKTSKVKNPKVSIEQFEKLIKENKNIVIDFYATWCGPCKILSPVLEKLEKQSNGKFVVYKIDVDQSSDLVRKMNITAIPTLHFYKNGKLVKVEEGFEDESLLKRTLTNTYNK